jgi:serine/threonine protein kinase
LANFLLTAPDRDVSPCTSGAACDEISIAVKLCDFGLCYKLKHKLERRKSFVGTPNYIAPEVLMANGDQLHDVLLKDIGYGSLNCDVSYSFPIDLWSLGVCMYVMMVGEPPFEGKDMKETYANILKNNCTFPKRMMYALSMCKIISNLLCADETVRMTSKELLKCLDNYKLQDNLKLEKRETVSETLRIKEKGKEEEDTFNSIHAMGCLDHSLV